MGPIPRNVSKSMGVDDHLESTLAPKAPDGGAVHAGMAGGRGGRVIRREESVHAGKEGNLTEGSSSVPAGQDESTAAVEQNPNSTKSNEVTEKDRPIFKKLAEDTETLIKWFKADDGSGEPQSSEVPLSDFNDGMKALGITPTKQLTALCENGDLSTSIRAITLLNTKAKNNIKLLDDRKKAQREARQAERAAKKAKAEAEKKAKKDAEEQAKRDAERILEIEASIILNVDQGSLPTDRNLKACPHETRFYRYNDNGLQFQFGSADFTGLKLFPDGTFEFKNGYKMEFSSARQFVEQSEGLFDDLSGTYDILWGEMKEESGKMVRRLPKEGVKEDTGVVRQPKRPTMEKRRSSRLLMGMQSTRASFARMSSRFLNASERSSAGDKGDQEVPIEDDTVPTPLELVLHPDDKESRRHGIDLTQRWGCYPPDKDGKVTTIQRKLSKTIAGEVFEFPDMPASRRAIGLPPLPTKN